MNIILMGLPMQVKELKQVKLSRNSQYPTFQLVTCSEKL